MIPLQPRLLPDPQPLVERLGKEFFRHVPRRPGVYQMRGQSDAVLYIGKAKDLRHRLGSYRVANPDRMARRTLRLLRLVETITWEECPDEQAALQREAELLLALKPRFNRIGVWQGPRRFLAWRSRPEGLELAVTESPEDGWHRAGPWGSQTRLLHEILIRLIWRRFHPARGIAGMPPGWFHGSHGSCVLIPQAQPDRAAEAASRLAALFAGDLDPLQQWLPPARTRFEQQIDEADLASLEEHLARARRRQPSRA